MNKLWTVALALLALPLLVEDADARRLGGGRSVGMQRSIAPPPVRQAPAQPAPAQSRQAGEPAPAQQPAAAPKWLGPLAGLALGAGLFALFLSHGWIGVLAGLLLLAAMIAAAALAVRAQRARVHARPLRFAGAPAGLRLGSSPAADESAACAPARWPPDFDAAEFLRHARRNFVRLQQAHDRRDLALLRDFLAPDLFREIEADLAAEPTGETEVLTLESEVLEVAAGAGRYIVSVAFSGLIREGAGAPEPFREIWHLEKPQEGTSGWMLAGIQQG